LVGDLGWRVQVAAPMPQYIPPIPLQWIAEHAVNNPSRFSEQFIGGSLHLLLTIALLDKISLKEDQPHLPPTLVIALLRRIFSPSSSLLSCYEDMGIDETIDYLGLVEQQRIKRIKALEKRGGPIIADFIRTANPSQSRFNFALIGIKYWVSSLVTNVVCVQ
jgi:hypothetical protein